MAHQAIPPYAATLRAWGARVPSARADVRARAPLLERPGCKCPNRDANEINNEPALASRATSGKQRESKMNVLKAIILGFIAGAIATVTVHEVISWLFLNFWTGWPRPSWSMTPAAYTGVPQIMSDTFWGGVWGALFPLVFGTMPRGPLTFKGLLYGLIGPALIGVFIAVPLMTGRFPPFFGGDMSKIIPVLTILGGFGASLGWLYGFFAYKRLPC